MHCVANHATELGVADDKGVHPGSTGSTAVVEKLAKCGFDSHNLANVQLAPV